MKRNLLWLLLADMNNTRCENLVHLALDQFQVRLAWDPFDRIPVRSTLPYANICWINFGSKTPEFHQLWAQHNSAASRSLAPTRRSLILPWQKPESCSLPAKEHVDFYWFLWISIDFYWFLLISIDFYWFLWISIQSTVFLMILPCHLKVCCLDGQEKEHRGNHLPRHLSWVEDQLVPRNV